MALKPPAKRVLELARAGQETAVAALVELLRR